MDKLEDVQILLEGLDESNISSILTKWKEITTVRKKLDEAEEMLKVKAKTYLKERQWDRYLDKETDISVTISKMKREVIDKKHLSMMLSEAQMAQVVRLTTFEKISIITPETRARLKKYVGKKTR